MIPDRPEVRDDLVLRQLDEELLVYDPEHDHLVLLNLSSALIFELCDATRTRREIADELAEAFAVPREEVLPGIESALQEFAAADLLRTAAPGRREAAAQ